MGETLAIIQESIRARTRLQHVVVNVAKLVNMRTDSVLRRDVEESDLINVDGTGVVWGCRLLGLPIPERVAGIDLMQNMLEMCEQENYRPYFLGAKQSILDDAIAQIRKQHPELNIAGFRNGYFSEEEEKSIVNEIRASKADCLFIAISSPMKENFLHKYRDDLSVPFLMGVGGSLDVVAGHVKRAPLWMQKFGLEWFYRMMQEPRRMWRRYLYTNSSYAILLGKEMLINSPLLKKN